MTDPAGTRPTAGDDRAAPDQLPDDSAPGDPAPGTAEPPERAGVPGTAEAGNPGLPDTQAGNPGAGEPGPPDTQAGNPGAGEPGPPDLGLLEGLATTRAIRRYRAEPIPGDALRRILFAATRAPSGSNRQPFRFLVLTDGPNAMAAKRLIGEAARRFWAAKRAHDGYDRGSGADPTSPKARMARTMEHYVEHFDEVPVLVLACLARYRRPTPLEGASVYPACQNLLLAARALGYGGVLNEFHVMVEDELRPLLGIPDGTAISATITLGRPQGSHGPVRRRPLAELVYGDHWDQQPSWAVDPEGTRHTRAGPPRRR